MSTPRLVLASGSPSRLKLLRDAGIEPAIRVSGVDEDAIAASLGPDAEPEQVISALARAKAEAGAAAGVDEITASGEAGTATEIIIGADSMLLIDGQLQGKPHTEEETVRRWHNQAGKTAELLTAHCVLYGARSVESVRRTRIHFATPTDADIAAYAATGEPFGCAGAFTLEAKGGWFIERIEGDPSSVIGLSLPFIREALGELGFSISEFWG